MRNIFRLPIILLIGFSFLGCSDNPKKSDFPPALVHKKGSQPIDAVKKIIDARYQILDEIAYKYLEYIDAIISDAQDKHTYFDYAIPLYKEASKSTGSLVTDFIFSPEGASLTYQDRQIIIKYLKNREVKNREIWEIGKDKASALSDQGMDHASLKYAFQGTYGAKIHLNKLDYQDLLTIARYIAIEMYKENRNDLWNDYTRFDYGYLEKYQQDDGETNLNTLVYRALRRFIWGDPVYRKPDGSLTDSWQSKLYGLDLSTGIIFDILQQGYLALPFDYVLIELAGNGVNDYLGEEFLASFNEKIKRAVYEVSKEDQQLLINMARERQTLLEYNRKK